MTAEELLATMEEPISEDGTYCTIDPETRLITIPPEYQLLGVENDKLVERIEFQCPKIVGDNKNLTEFQLRINYRNANDEKDQYIVTDVLEEGENILFSWELSRKVTAYRGIVSFIVCAVIVSDDFTVSNEWNTTVAESEVLEGLEASSQIVQENPDIIEEILKRLDTLETTGGGGTSDYNDLDNMPTMNNVEIKGALTGEDVGLIDRNQGTENAGKTLVVGEDGNLVVGDYSGGNVDTEKLLAIAIKPKTSGASPLTAKDSAGFDLLDMSVDGLSEQVSTTGAQLFNKSTANSGACISDNDGIEYSLEDTYASDYIAVVGLSNIICSNTERRMWMAFYDAEKTFVSGKNGYSAPIPVPENAAFARFTIANESIDSFMLNDGSVLKPYEPYTGGQPSPSPEYPQEIKNLGDMGWFDGLWEQGMCAIADGNYNNNTITICCANPIPAKAGDKVKLEYKSSGYRLFLLAYDTNNNYISSKIETSGTATSITWDSLPENTAYVRFDIQTVDASTITPSDAAHTCVTINDKYMVKVDLVGKNLFDKMKCSNADAWTPGIDYYYIAIPVPKGSKVSFSYAEKPPAGLGFYSCISKKPGEPNVSYKWLYHSKRGDLINNSATFTAESDEIYLSLNSPSINVELFMQYIGNTLQIEVSDVLTDYQPYKEQTVTLTSDRPLTKWDKLEKRNGVWGWVYKSNTVTLDGSEDEHWRIVESGNLKAYTINNLNNIQQEDYEAVFCNKFKGVSFENRDFSIDCICMTSKKSEGNQYVRFNYFSIEDLSAWKIFLQSNPIIINYETAEETFIPFSESEQEQLNSLKTYYPSTTFRVTQNSNLSVQYVADPENYIKNLITPIATQMLNQ